LHRQILYTETDIGKYKAETAASRLKAFNPSTVVKSYTQKMTEATAPAIIQEFDLVVDGSDNFSTRYLVNDVCVELQKPLVYGSILNFEGQVAVFLPEKRKNLRDIFPEPPAPEDVPNCDENGVIGTLPGIIGTIMAQEVIKLVCGMHQSQQALLLFNTKDWRLETLNF
jgi:adenylyltransferase/sulfurtransferase